MSQLGSLVSAEVRLVAREKMLRCIECKPTLLDMAKQEEWEIQLYRSDRGVMCCSGMALKTPSGVAAAKGELEPQVGVVR